MRNAYDKWLAGEGCCNANNFIHIESADCKKEDVCECERILLEISNLHTDDLVLQEQIDELSGDVANKLDASAYTPTDLSDYYTKEQVDALIPEVPSLSGYATEQWVQEQGYLTEHQPLKTINNQVISGTGNITISAETPDLSNYYTKEEVDELMPVVPINVSAFYNDANYVTSSVLSVYISNLQEQINSLIASVSGCCGSSGETQYRWITMTGDNDYVCSGTTKMSKEKQQSSTDGINWTDTGSYRAGSTVLENNSYDCGYIPQNIKLTATYNDNTVHYVACDEYSELRTTDTHYTLNNYQIKEAVIGNCVTEIGAKAFAYCTSLSSVTIPNTVSTFATGAFYICSALTSVNIPSGVTTINGEAFSGCSSLTSIEIPNGVIGLSGNVFGNCTSLENVTIGTGCTAITSHAFNGCVNLQSITIKATTPPHLVISPFSNTNNTFTIYVPSSAVNTYKTSSYWSSYSSRIRAIPT